MKFREFFIQFLESVTISALSVEIRNFLEQLSIYQSNHNGYYDSKFLYNAYHALPEDVRAQLSANRKKYKNMFRGDDGRNDKPVMSFTWNPNPQISANNAKFYGNQLISFEKDVKGFDGIVDVANLEKYFGRVLWQKLSNQYPIGDDENEILVFGGKLKNDPIAQSVALLKQQQGQKAFQ